MMRLKTNASLCFKWRGSLSLYRRQRSSCAGPADPIVPLLHARALADLLPNARFVAIDNGGHIPLVDHRAEVETAIRAFLSELSR